MRTKPDPETETRRRDVAQLEAERQWRADRVRVAEERLAAARRMYHAYRDSSLADQMWAAVARAERALGTAQRDLDDHDAALIAARVRLSNHDALKETGPC
jgi:hypothetical protein